MEDEREAAIRKFRDLGLSPALEGDRPRPEDGTYGTCEECGALVEAARLAALPEATTCLRCQQTRSAPPPTGPRSTPGQLERTMHYGVTSHTRRGGLS